MNSSLSVLLRRPYGILKCFSKTMTKQIHTLQVVPINKMKTTNNNITFFRNQSLYSTLRNIPSNDLLHLCDFLHEGLDWKISTYNLFVPVLDRLTRSKSIETLISDLQSFGFLNDDVNANLLSLLSHAGKNKMLIDAYRHMVKSHGFVPDADALYYLVDSLFTTSQTLAALTVLEQMKSPHSSFFELILFHIPYLTDITSLHLTSSVFFRLIPYYPNKVTFNKVLISFCKMNGDVLPQVYQLLGLKVKLGIEFSIDGWTSIIHKCGKLGRLHDATKLFFDMIQTGSSLDVVPVTLTVLFKAFLDSNMVDDALHLFNAILAEGFVPSKFSFVGLVTALCAEGRMSEAVRAYCDIVIEQPYSDFHLDNHIPLMIITELINAGMTDEAATVLGLSRSQRTQKAWLPSSLVY